MSDVVDCGRFLAETLVAERGKRRVLFMDTRQDRPDAYESLIKFVDNRRVLRLGVDRFEFTINDDGDEKTHDVVVADRLRVDPSCVTQLRGQRSDAVVFGCHGFRRFVTEERRLVYEFLIPMFHCSVPLIVLVPRSSSSPYMDIDALRAMSIVKALDAEGAIEWVNVND